MPDVDLATLADAGAFVSHEHQAHLAEAVRIGDWHIDAAGSAFAFTDGAGAEHRARAHFIGTSSPDDGTWLWGWQNVNGFPAGFVKRSERVRALGERYGIPEFTTGALPLTDALPATLLRAVKAVTGVTAHFSAPTGNGGTRAYLLLDDDSLELPPPTVLRTVAVVTSALAAGGPVDHRRALTAWTEQRGVRLVDGGSEVVELELDDGSLQVRFDDEDRIAGLGKRLRTTRPVPRIPAPEPAPVPQEAEPSAPAAEDDPLPETPEPVPAARRGFLQRLLGRA